MSDIIGIGMKETHNPKSLNIKYHICCKKGNVNNTLDFKIFKLPVVQFILNPFNRDEYLTNDELEKFTETNIVPFINADGREVEVWLEPWITLNGIKGNKYAFEIINDILRGDSPESSYSTVQMTGNYFTGIRHVQY